MEFYFDYVASQGFPFQIHFQESVNDLNFYPTIELRVTQGNCSRIAKIVHHSVEKYCISKTVFAKL